MQQKVELPTYLMSSLFLDSVFKSYAKTRNNVGSKPEHCTKPRLNDSNFEISPLKRQTCRRVDGNDPIRLEILPGSCNFATLDIKTVWSDMS